MLPSVELQAYLATTGRYKGAIDGDQPGWYGPQTKAAIMLAFTDGPDTPLVIADYVKSAERLLTKPSHIMAFATVEASGAGFQDGVPKVLFEPHRFSGATKHVWDKTHPTISYPTWGMRPYPATQGARYAQIIEAVGLGVAAGFASASYGKFQILGENYAACGYNNPWEFAFGQAKGEASQLAAFEGFITYNSLLGPLRDMSVTPISCVAIAKGYNGTAYAKNGYHQKLASAVQKYAYLDK